MDDVIQVPGDEIDTKDSTKSDSSVQADGSPAEAEAVETPPIYVRLSRGAVSHDPAPPLQEPDAAQPPVTQPANNEKKNGQVASPDLPFGNAPGSTETATNGIVIVPPSRGAKASPFFGERVDRKAASVQSD